MNFINIIDRYILKKFLSSFFFGMMIMAVISCVIDYSEKIEDFMINHAPVGKIIQYFIFFVPSILSILYPLFIFLSTIFFTSKMAYKTEIIAVLSTGTSFRRFLRPFMIGGIILGIGALVANHFIVPLTSIQMNHFLKNYFWDKKIATNGNVHLKITDDTYIFMENFTFSTKEGRQFTWEKVDGTLLKEKVFADRAVYNSKKKLWMLRNVVILKNDGIKEELIKKRELNVRYNFTPEDLDLERNVKAQMTTPRLLAFIEREKSRGTENYTEFELELHKRTAQPFAGLILVIIGACIASRKVRGGSGYHLAVGISMSALYILMMQLTSTFATNSGLDPLIAVWIPNIIFSVVAFVLYRRQMK